MPRRNRLLRGIGKNSDVPDVVIRQEKQRQCAGADVRARNRLVIDRQNFLRRLCAPAKKVRQNLRVRLAVGMGNADGLRFGLHNQCLIALGHLLDRALPAADLREADDLALGVALE